MFPFQSVLITAAAYFCGSFPSAYLIVRIFYGKSIFESGSGNGGAANVYRLYGRMPAAAVFLLDFSKGFLPVLAADISGRPPLDLLLMATAAFLGHAFPLWTGFKGGKGVAVTAGTVTALMPAVAPFCLAAFILTALLSSYVSLASLVTALSLPLFYLIFHMISPQPGFALFEGFFALLFLLVLFLHRSNIKRLLRGEERSIGKPKQDKGASSPEDGD